MEMESNILGGIDLGSTLSESVKIFRQKCLNKWSPLIEAKGDNLAVVPDNMKMNLAVVMENQAIHSSRVAKAGMFEQTTLSDVTLPVKFALPLIRQAYPNLWATKVAAIQPLAAISGGVGQIFYLDFLYEDTEDEPSTTTPDSNYALSSENAVPKRLKMTITAETITAYKDILAATWSSEVMEDVMGTLGLNVHQELITHCAQEIVREMDYRVLAAMIGGATAGAVSWSSTVPAGSTDKEHYETLGHAFIDASALIAAKRYRRGEWIVAGQNVVKYLRKMQDFKPTPDRDVYTQPTTQGVELVGRIEGFWNVYTSFSIDDDLALMGVYPRSQMDTGFVLAPYIPIEAMPLIYADMTAVTGVYTNKDKWTRNVRTRYAYKVVVGDLFATVTIT